jgi:hypothetical protein
MGFTLKRFLTIALALFAAAPSAGDPGAPDGVAGSWAQASPPSISSSSPTADSGDTFAALRRLRANFQKSATPATPSLVRLVKTGRSRDTVTVSVVLGGPSPAADIYSWAFDLALSGVPVEYVAGSAVAGNALVPGAGQGVTVQAAQVGNRVVVGVSKTGGGPGSVLASPQATVVSLTFRVLAKGKTFVSFAGPPAPAPNTSPTGPAALDSDGGVIAGIAFDTATGVIVAKKAS